MDSQNAGIVVLDVDELIDAFMRGLVKFGADVENDMELQRLVSHHAQAMFEHLQIRI